MITVVESLLMVSWVNLSEEKDQAWPEALASVLVGNPGYRKWFIDPGNSRWVEVFSIAKGNHHSVHAQRHSLPLISYIAGHEWERRQSGKETSHPALSRIIQL